MRGTVLIACGSRCDHHMVPRARPMGTCTRTMGTSMRRYRPPMGTAGLARVLVRGKRRLPAPPPRMMAAGTGRDQRQCYGRDRQCSVRRQRWLQRCYSPSTLLVLAFVDAGSNLRGASTALALTCCTKQRDLEAAMISQQRVHVPIHEWMGVGGQEIRLQLHTHLEEVHAPLAFDRPSITDRPERHRSDVGITWHSAARVCFSALLVRKPWS